MVVYKGFPGMSSFAARTFLFCTKVNNCQILKYEKKKTRLVSKMY